MSIHSLVVETPSHGSSSTPGWATTSEPQRADLNNRQDPFLDRLTAASFPPDSIDTVLARICMSTMSVEH